MEKSCQNLFIKENLESLTIVSKLDYFQSQTIIRRKQAAGLTVQGLWLEGRVVAIRIAIAYG